MSLPYTFATQAGPIPLSQVDANFTYLNQSAPGFNVVSYGADPTGVTDSTAAIVAAIAAANTAGGGLVYYPSGTYLVNSAGVTPISYAYGNISHQGASTESVIIVNASATAPAFTVGNGVTQIYGGGFRAMRFTTKVGVIATANLAILAQKWGQFRIEDLFVSASLSAMWNGLYFSSCSQFFVYGTQVQGCLSNGISNVNGLDAYITDCRSDANGGAGWLLNGSQGGYYKGCTAYNNSGTAWNLTSTSPSSAPNFNNFFLECIGDTSGGYNWQINDSVNSFWLGCWGSTQQSAAAVTYATGFIIASVNSRDLVFTGCVANYNNSHGFQVYDSGSNAPVNIHFVNCQGGTQGVLGSNGNGQSGSGYGLTVGGACNQIRVLGGTYLNNASGSLQNSASGTDIIFDKAVGFASVNQGTSSVAVSSSSIAITHGLGFTPTLANIHITPTSSAAASGISSFWVSNPTGTQFTVNTNTSVSTTAFNFAWRASYNGA